MQIQWKSSESKRVETWTVDALSDPCYGRELELSSPAKLGVEQLV